MPLFEVMVLSLYRSMIVFSHVMLIIPHNDALMSCKNTNDSIVTIHLSCNSSHWIHVRGEEYSNTTLEQGCLNTTNSCTKSRMTDMDSLIVTCNGKQTCFEEVRDTSTCTPVRSYKIIYDCVEESLDVCSSENKSTNKAVYLHSPGFPGSDGVADKCTCRITGRRMLIRMIEHRRNKKDLNISTDGDNLEEGSLPPVNRIIVQRANHITLNYQGMGGGRFWIKVTGSGMIDVKCSNESNIIPSTTMATTTPDITEESSSTGMVNATYSKEASTASSDTTSSDTTSIGNTAESSDTGMVNDTSTASSDTTSIGNTAESSDTGMVNDTSTASSDTTFSDTASSDTTTISNTSESSDTESPSNISTTKEEIAEELRDGPLSIIALASIGAAGVFVVLVLFIVGVICCRRMRKSDVRMGHKNTASVELGHITMGPGQSGKTSVIANPNYFQLDPDFVSLDRKKADEEASISREECHSMPQYAIVSRNSRVPAYDNNILNDDDQGMVMNDIFVSGPSNKEQPEEGMVDNFLHQTCKQSNTASAMNQSESPVTQDDIGGKDEGMVINDFNHSDQPPFVDQHVKTIAQQSPQIDHRCNSDGEGTTDRDTGGGMMVNDLYHSYQASQGNQHSDGDIPALSAQIEQPDNGDQLENTAGMVINDLYHSYQSPQKSQNLSKDQEPKGGAEEFDNDSLVVENDLYCKEIKPSQDEVTQRKSGGHYEEIVNNELADPGDLRGQGPKLRPPAYEDIADITSVS